VPRGDPLARRRVGLAQQVAELGERVAAHARDRRAAARVLVHEVVAPRRARSGLEVEHVVRHAEPLAHAPRVVDRVERAARAVGHVVAVAEELHRRPDHVVALLDEQRRRDRRVDAAAHRDEHPPRARPAPSPGAPAAPATRARALAASAGTARHARRHARRRGERADAQPHRAAASVGSTPIASSTCDGDTLPVWHAEPPDAATPCRSSAMSSDSPSTPGTLTLSHVRRARARRGRGSPRRARGEDRGLERVAQRARGARTRLALGDRELGGGREPHGVGHVLGAGAPAAVLRAAVEQRRERVPRRT
jgi:hypothetical protein